MIVFVPAYDPATRANLAVASDLVANSDIALLAGHATRVNLFEALRARAGAALFSMSHGSADQLSAQDGHIGLTREDAAEIGSRRVYVFACHTASRLGSDMSRGGVTWWGYTGAIQCPEDAEPFRHLFVDLFRFVRAAFVAAATADARRVVIEEIARRCEAAQGEIDEHARRDPDVNVWSAYHCLLHIWDRLRVWVPDAAIPEAHRRAQPPSLFLAE